MRSFLQLFFQLSQLFKRLAAGTYWRCCLVGSQPILCRAQSSTMPVQQRSLLHVRQCATILYPTQAVINVLPNLLHQYQSSSNSYSIIIQFMSFIHITKWFQVGYDANQRISISIHPWNPWYPHLEGWLKLYQVVQIIFQLQFLRPKMELATTAGKACSFTGVFLSVLGTWE